MHKILQANDGRRTTILHGLGGMGKTQLAAAYIKRHHTDYSAVVWLNARDETSLKQSFAHAAERILQQHPSTVYIQNAIKDRDLDQITDAVKRWLGEIRNNRWLAIYDNYDDPKFHKSTSGQETSKENGKGEPGTASLESQISPEKGFDIRPFFPSTYQGAIIITTRSSDVRLGEVVRVGKLKDIHDSLRILASTSHRQGLDNDDAALRLAQRLDGLPLALSTAGSYLSQVSTSWAEYLELYNKSWLRLQETSPQLLTYDSAMYTTWDISYRHIERDDKNAAKLLQLWAYFDHQDLWFELLQSSAKGAEYWLLQTTQDRLSFDQTMRVLCGHGLVEANSPTGKWGTQSSGYSVHECVHSWMVHVLNKGANEDMSQLAMRGVASHIPSMDVPEYWLVQRRLLRHADQCHTMLTKGQKLQNREWIPVALGVLYANQGRLDKAEDMYNRALQGYEKALRIPKVDTYPPALRTMENLGDLLWDAGQPEAAQKYYLRAEGGIRLVYGSQNDGYRRLSSKLKHCN
jgi:tetratricopeptide (TPR) repeat protein